MWRCDRLNLKFSRGPSCRLRAVLWWLLWYWREQLICEQWNWHQRSHSQSATGRQTNSVCVVSADSSAAFWRWENAKRGFSFCVTKAVPPIEHSHWESCWNKGKIVAYCQFKANTAAALWSFFFSGGALINMRKLRWCLLPGPIVPWASASLMLQMLALGCCCCCCWWW